jgi:hypothetical protein
MNQIEAAIGENNTFALLVQDIRKGSQFGCGDDFIDDH